MTANRPIEAETKAREAEVTNLHAVAITDKMTIRYFRRVIWQRLKQLRGAALKETHEG